ncbi:MAG TPA: helix-turn-helix transcriptional regulator [Kribbella sp.]|jgi:transcriptional regulator with XRE-family HTH domain
MGQVFRSYRTDEFQKTWYGPSGIKQAWLGKWLGLTQAQVSRIERGESKAQNLETLAQWAQTLHMPPDLLWFDLPHYRRRRVKKTAERRQTLLKKLIDQRYWSYSRFCKEYDSTARTLHQDLIGTYPSKSTYRRWLDGQLDNLPRSEPRVVLGAMFPAHSIEELFTTAQTLGDQNERGVLRLAARSQELRAPIAEDSGIADGLSRIDLADDPSSYIKKISIETPVPSRIGWPEVEHIRSTTRAVATAENIFGGGLSCEAALGQLRWASKLLESNADPDVRRAMLEAVGNLSSVVAYSAFDVAAYSAADHCFHFSLWCADQSGSWSLRANTLAEMSRKSAYLGNVDEALSMIEFAQVRSDRLTSTARAMLCTLRARLLAVTGRFGDARSDIDKADEHIHDRTPGDDPPWLTYYDIAEHNGSTGKALIPIAKAERHVEVAAPRLREAIELHHADYPRSRAFSRTRLATLAMDLGDPREAVSIGRQALSDVAPLRSARIAKELRGLAHVSSQYPQIGDVCDLRHDILSLSLSRD